MQHVVIDEFGSAVGLTSERLVIRQDEQERHIPLRRISTVTISKKGVSISSNLLAACARHGIKVFIGNRSQEMCSLQGVAQHAVVQNRIHQFQFLSDDEQKHRLSRAFIYGKLRNQRANLLYFQKQECLTQIKLQNQSAAAILQELAESVRNLEYHEGWYHRLLGLEGQGARSYWQAQKDGGWLGPNFERRTGRGATDAANQALNYGYGILMSVIWNALTNAGLEPYLGALHAVRPGKPSLVLDLMEEYRAWVVDRHVIKMRPELNAPHLKPATRRKLTSYVLASLEKSVPYHGKKVRLESVIQRQAYRLCGMFSGERAYRPVLFKW